MTNTMKSLINDDCIVILKAGTQQLELAPGGYVVTDGWLTDWIILMEHNGTWVRDGVLNINKPIINKLNQIAYNEYIKTNRS